MLTQSTHIYATHEIPLECDVYTADDHYPDTTESPVFLFFHSGGLAGGARMCIPPWLAQVCYQRRWILISPEYRLLPQAGAKGLLEDATAAYDFAQTFGASVSGGKRPVIVGGASAGFFMANLIAHHVHPKPIAMLSITGISTFRHPFFNSSTLLRPTPIKDEEVSGFLNAPAEVEVTPIYDPTVFKIERLLPSGERNPDYAHPARPVDADENPASINRDCLYDYWLYKNSFVDLVGDVDPGFEWAKQASDSDKLKEWPPTIFIQGDNDTDVSMHVTTSTFDLLGSDKAKLCLAKGEGHLFESKSYLEDGTPGMDVVREAVKMLDTEVGV